MTKPKLIMAAVESILPSKDNPRIVSEDPGELNSDGLLDSVKAIGVQQPLQVRDHPAESGRKELLAGERRWMCCKVLGAETVMVLDYGRMPDDEAFRITCIENAHRKELKPLEQGRAASIALARCNGDVKAAAALLGQTPRWIAMGAKIHDGLAKIWQDGLVKNENLRRWTAGHVALIARFPENVQKDLYESIAKVQWLAKEISVEGLAKKTAEVLHVLAKAPFDTAGCAVCLKRSGTDHLLWADDEEDATGKKERCLDAKCWQEKETQAARRAFSDKAKDHKGLVAVDLSKQSDYQQREELKRVYGDNLLETRHYGVPKFEVVKAETKGAIPALVVGGAGKGTVKYIKRSKAPNSPSSGSSKKSKAEKEAVRGKKRLLFAVRDILVQRIDAGTVQQVMDNPKCLTGFLFAAVFSGGSGDPLFGRERTEFLDAWRDMADDGDRIRFLYGKLWATTKEVLKDTVFADYNLEGVEAEEDMSLVAGAFGWDYTSVVEEARTMLDRKEDLDKRTERIGVALPKSRNTTCELRILEDEGKWYGGFLIEIPKARADLPVDTRGDVYESKAACLQMMVERVKHELAGFKLKKSCPAALYKEIVAELDKIAKACELEKDRTFEHRLLDGTEGQGPAPTGTDLAGATHASPVRESGVLEDPELISVRLDAAWKAKITIKVGRPLPMGAGWFAGYDAHVPGAGDVFPCSTANTEYPSRDEAIVAATSRITGWLHDKPGKRGYRYHADIAARLGELAAKHIQAKAQASKPVMRCTFPPAAREPIAVPKKGDRKCRVCGLTKPECTHCAGTVCPVCLWEEADLCAVCAEAGEGKSSSPKAADRDGPPVADVPRFLMVAFPESWQAKCELRVQRVDGQWFGGYTIDALQAFQLMNIDVKDKPSPTKPQCLIGLCDQIRKWLMVAAGTGKAGKSRAIQIANRIEEAVEEENAKSTCRVCGCTEDNCQACIEATGEACHWVEQDLCSRCQ